MRVAVRIDADRHQLGVDQLDERGVRVRRLIHHVAPVAPHGRDPEQQRFVLALGAFERLGAPLVPCDLVCSIRTWREVKYGFGHGSALSSLRTRSRVASAPGLYWEGGACTRGAVRPPEWELHVACRVFTLAKRAPSEPPHHAPSAPPPGVTPSEQQSPPHIFVLPRSPARRRSCVPG